MVLFAPEIDGAMFGFGLMIYSNGVRKMRLMRRTPCQRSLKSARYLGSL